MTEPLVLSPEQLEVLRCELSRDDLTIFTCVRMARNDVAQGHLDNAMARLSMDLDKLRTYSKPLVELVVRARGY